MWAFTYIFVLLVCFNSCIALSVSNSEPLTEQLTWPTEYYLKGEELDIVTGIKETFEIWYSANLNRSRIDYYGGICQKYYYGKTENATGTLYELHPITTEETYNELKCFEFPHSKEAEDYLPSVDKFTFKGTKDDTNMTLQIWERTKTFQSSRKVEARVLAYVQDDAHIPVQIVLKVFNLEKGSIDEHTITNYYGYESEFDEDDLDLDIDYYGCSKPYYYGQSLANDLKYIHPGIAADSDFAFQRFKLHHKKQYDRHEHETRQQIFYKNWKLITEHNKKNLSYKMEVNTFADRTMDELKFLTGTKSSISVADPNLFSDTSNLLQSVDQLPEELDLRLEGVISPVKNQASCGSCWAFCTTAAVEGALARKNGGRDLDLSEQSLVDCSWGFGNMGCEGGMVDNAMKYVLAHGIPTEREYGPYLAKEGLCDIQNMSRVYNINGFGQVTPRNVEALKVALNKYGPVVVGVHAGDNMKFYSNGIFYDVNCDGEATNHGVTVVGYGVRNGDTYWIVKNSWGENWGEDGYILISATNNNCLLLDIAYYPIV